MRNDNRREARGARHEAGGPTAPASPPSPRGERAGVRCGPQITSAVERPILFSAPMVRAILEGRKTQTRRVVKEQPRLTWSDSRFEWQHFTDRPVGAIQQLLPPYCPHGQSGDRLWVRETFALHRGDAKEFGKPIVFYRARGDIIAGLNRWRPSIHMPRWASRLTLEILRIRVERLQDITTKDCEDEGVQYPVAESNTPGKVIPLLTLTDPWLLKHQPKPKDVSHDSLMRAHYAALWDSLNAARGFAWAKNPWVWVIEFKSCSRS